MVVEQKTVSPKIVKLASDKMFFEVFDNLTSKDRETGELSFNPQYRMLKFTILNHTQKVNGKSAWVWFSMHERDFMLLRNAILSRKLGTKAEGNHFVSYKGTENKAYETGFQSRIIEIEKQPPMKTPGRPDVGNKAKILITIENGAGVKGKTGQVMPAQTSEGKIKQMFPMDEGVAIAMVEEIYMYLSGWHATFAKNVVNSHIEFASIRNDSTATEAVVNVTQEDVGDDYQPSSENLY